jgi:niacin transporter
MKTKELTAGAMLAAMSMLIPLMFGGFLSIQIPPFSATIMAHLPLFLAMLINPMTAVLVGLASALGFFLKLGYIVGLRALMHAVVGFVGAKLIKKGFSFPAALAVTMPIHALLEAIVVIPFFGFNIYRICVVVAIGTALHHTIDSGIAIVFSGILKGVVKLPVFSSSSKN